MKLGSMTRKKDFRLIGEIGRGSSGKVDKAQRKDDGKVCVCKQISLDTLKTEKQRDQALNEAKIMRQLKCPYIVEYMDAFIENDSLFLILQYCPGGDLKSYMRKTRAKALSNRSIWRYSLRIALGLQYLHSKRVLHRDLKSENIFLFGADENLRVGDLGLSRMLNNSQSGASTLVGTPRYLSPEEVKGVSHYTDKCDVWSLGVIVYELCSDSHRGPFDHAVKLPELMKAILDEDPPCLPQRVDKLKEVCSMLLEKDPSRRLTTDKLLTLKTSLDAIERHGVLEMAPEACSDLPQTATAPGTSSAQPLEVPDGCCSRLQKMVRLGNGESGLGVRFKRYAYCEMCHAQRVEPARSHFGLLFRRHHCRNCGRSVCHNHSLRTRSLPQLGYATPQRICESCSNVPADEPFETISGTTVSR